MRPFMILLWVLFMSASSYSDTWYVPDDYGTIQDAIDAVLDGDTIIVKPGTYVENIDFKGKPITLKSNGVAEATVIDGNQAGSVVSFVNAEGIDSVLDGFMLVNGNHTDGGGIICTHSSPTITNNTISGNSAVYCGGIYCSEASPIITNTVITGNMALNVGGIWCYDNSFPILTNNTIAGNTGLVMRCRKSSPIITNTILWGGLFFELSSPVITYCNVKGGTGQPWFGEGCIDANPYFLAPKDDHHIVHFSPCRNAGTNDATLLPKTDFEGDDRTLEGTVDIGADEFSFPHGSSGTYHVPGDYLSIQEAVDSAFPLDTIIVGQGTYIENIDFLGKSITVKSSHGPETTIIVGNQAGSVVTLNSGEYTDTVLDGFTVMNGSGTDIWGNGTFEGGGIFCSPSSSPTIMNNIITGNSADCGGGICCGNAVITNNVITQNEALGGGGGIDCNGSQIMNNVIAENTAGWGGGGVASDSSLIANNLIMMNFAQYGGGIADRTSTIMNNIITKNYAVEGGGGICGGGSGGKSFIINNIISWNKTDPQSFGGGIYWVNHNAIFWLLPEIINCVIYGNSSCYGGGICVSGILGSSPPNNDLINSILWNNEAILGPEIYVGSSIDLNISFSNIKGGQASVYGSPEWGPGIIDADPMFVDPVNGDFHLTFPSPCKDTGDNSAVTELCDFEGDPRIAYGSVDMGADEFYTHLYWTGDATPAGNVALKFVGLPGTMPVQLWLGSGTMDPPMHTKYGDWHLQFPLLASLGLGSIPSPDGIMALPLTIPPGTPVPLNLPLQALIGMELTNLSVMVIE